MFRLLFERSADAIWLYDPEVGVFVDCNQAAVEQMCRRAAHAPYSASDAATSLQFSIT